jgi:capsular exopolysaccharide synthesis family protein
MTPQNPPPTPPAWLSSRLERPSVMRYAQALRSRWWLVALFFIASMAGAVAYVSTAHKTYQAQADVLVTPVSEDDSNLEGLSLIRDTSDPTADVLTVAKLVGSLQIAQQVAKDIGGSPGELSAAVQATPVTESDIIAIQATASSAARAAQIANSFASETLTEQTNELHRELNTLIPALRASAKTLTAAEASSVASELAVLETLRVSPDPTLSLSSDASIPGSAASPNVKLSLVGGGFVGIVLGLLAVFALQAIDPRLRDEEQLRDVFRLPLLARIPRQRSERTALVPRKLSPPVEETFRNLRSQFTLQDSTLDRGRTILVTGDNPGNGKTTVAINLAASLVAAGKQVILIEADLRRPTIGETLRVRADHGIGDVLNGKLPLVDALVWVRPYGPQLEILLADMADEATADRLSNEAARKLLAEASTIADYVIVDSPPLPAASEALAFAETVDDIVIVARIGHSQVRRLSDMGELLELRGLVPRGIVLVAVPDSDVSTYYYGRKEAAPSAETQLWGLIQRRGSDTLERTKTNGNGNGVHVNGNGVHTNGNGVHTNGNGVHAG